MEYEKPKSMLTLTKVLIYQKKAMQKVANLVLYEDFQNGADNCQEIVEDYQQIPKTDKFHFLIICQRQTASTSKVCSSFLQCTQTKKFSATEKRSTMKNSIFLTTTSLSPRRKYSNFWKYPNFFYTVRDRWK